MGYQNVFKRYEIKYLITKEQQQLIKAAMCEYMLEDKFGESIISNIYFDTPDKLLVRRSNEKPVYKEKLRVRSYSVAGPDSTVFIELKKKYKGVVYKRRIDMCEQQAMDYLCKNTSVNHPTQITREIDYFYNLYQNIEPSAFLSYEREAFFSKTDKDFRITFDKNILFREYDLSLTKGIYGEALLSPNMVLMEVKTALGVPLWLTKVLSENNIYKTSFSKYGIGYKTIILPKALEGVHSVA